MRHDKPWIEYKVEYVNDTSTEAIQNKLNEVCKDKSGWRFVGSIKSYDNLSCYLIFEMIT